LSQEIKFTPSPSDIQRDSEAPPSFWEELFRIDENEWGAEDQKGYKVYLYDNEARGKYLAVIYQPFDIEWVRQNYGGGSYKAMLNDPSGKIVCREIFAIDGESKRKPPQSVQNSPSVAHPATDSFQSQVLEIIRQGQERQERFLERFMQRQDNPGVAAASLDPTRQFESMVTLFTTLMGKLMPAQPQQQPMNIMEIIAVAEKLRGPDLLEVLSKAKTAGIIGGAAAGGDLLTQVAQLKEVAEAIGFSPGEGKSWAQTLIEKGPEILEAGAKLIDKYKTVEDTRLATARTMHTMQQQRGATVVPPLPPAAPGRGIDVEPVGAPAGEPTPQMIADADRQLTMIKTKIVELMSKGRNGVDIVAFLDDIDEQICAGFEGMTPQELELVFTSDPLLQKATLLPNFKQVIAQIVEELNSGGDQELEPPKAN
jgi:hypothetical protein